MEAAELPTALGRGFETAERVHLGSMLVRDGLITAQQLEWALAEKESGGRRLGEIVVERGWITPSALARAEKDFREGPAPPAPAITLEIALTARASDGGPPALPSDPAARGLPARAGVAGVMRKLTAIPKSMQPAVTSRLKIMGELDIAE